MRGEATVANRVENMKPAVDYYSLGFNYNSLLLDLLNFMLSILAMVHAFALFSSFRDVSCAHLHLRYG